MTFHVGQKIVCVDDAWRCSVNRSNPAEYSLPCKGSIWTVAQSYIDARTSVPCIVLAEFHYYHGFEADCFRPITENKTDISIFTQILDRVNGKVRERA